MLVLTFPARPFARLIALVTTFWTIDLFYQLVHNHALQLPLSLHSLIPTLLNHCCDCFFVFFWQYTFLAPIPPFWLRRRFEYITAGWQPACSVAWKQDYFKNKQISKNGHLWKKNKKNSKVQMLAFIHWGETTLIASNRKAANSTEAWCTAGLTDINVHSTEATGQAFHRVSGILFYFIFWSFLFPSRS